MHVETAAGEVTTHEVVNAVDSVPTSLNPLFVTGAGSKDDPNPDIWITQKRVTRSRVTLTIREAHDLDQSLFVGLMAKQARAAESPAPSCPLVQVTPTCRGSPGR